MRGTEPPAKKEDCEVKDIYMLKLKYEGFKFSHCMQYAMSLLFNQNFYFRQSVVIFCFYV